MSPTLKRMLRVRVLPAAIWVATMGMVAYLWSDSGQRSPIMGFAEGVTHQVGSTFSGRVLTLTTELGEQVSAGQVLATLDPQEIDAEIRIEQAELERIKAMHAQEQVRALAAARGFAQASDGAKLALVKAQAELRMRSNELAVVTAKRKELEALLAKQMVVRQDLIKVELRQSELEAEVEAARAAVQILRPQLVSAETRGGRVPLEFADSPLQAQLAVVERRLERLLARRERLTLRSPCDGHVSQIARRAGDAVPAGQPVLAVTAPPTNRVVACAYEYEAPLVHVGATAFLFSRTEGGGTLRGRIVGIGPIMELPVRCWPQPRQTTWGRMVSIVLDKPAPLVAGQAFNVRLEGKRNGSTGEALAAPVTRTSAPATTSASGVALMTVPDALRAISRFEPSGLIWVPRLARYVVVSDDTGLKESDDHAPWLFAMDAQGRVDAKPLRIDGVQTVNDLESIAAGKNGALYVLSSQTYSKKGKRKADRQAFLRIAPAGAGYRVEAKVALADLLDGEPSARARLGITDTRQLNIEGMTAAADGGLLIGLKAPVTDDGQALVWRMRDPDRLLRTGKLSDAGLELFAKVKLSVEADGRNVAGGIAAMLQLPDRSLVIAATASSGKAAKQSGSLWHARWPSSRGGSLAARRIHTFSGLKPEGLSLSPRPKHFMVVFDAGAEIPSFQELPWPRD
jgi:multidrug resistance efflux pump